MFLQWSGMVSLGGTMGAAVTAVAGFSPLYLAMRKVESVGLKPRAFSKGGEWRRERGKCTGIAARVRRAKCFPLRGNSRC